MKPVKKTKPAPWMSAFPLQRVKHLPAGVLGVAMGFDEAGRLTKPFVVFKRIRPVSKRRQKVTEQYRREAQAFVAAQRAAGRTCPVVAAIAELREGRKYGWPISNKLNEVHHTHGRTGRLLMYKPWWMAVSKQGHRWIHEHPEEARKRGWLCQDGKWNSAPANNVIDLPEGNL